jgi:geranylgeranyl pyrophosphate synthase
MAMLIEHLKPYLETLGAEVEAALRDFCRTRGAENVANLHDGITYALGADIDDPALRGKRIRPLLCLLTAEALGAPRTHAMPFALSIELMHNFALVHDDMEDGDIMRRGRESAWIKYGIPHAINIGDYLLVQTMAALTESGPAELTPQTRFELLRLITTALDHTHIGQALDMNARFSTTFNIADYLRIVREKTGYYLAAPIQGGAIVAGAAPEVLERIGAMAQFLGPLFQIIDDIIDLTDGKGREAIGSDIREGKRSYLVAHAAENASEAERTELFAILDKPRAETQSEDIHRAIEIFDHHQSIAAGRAYCQELHAQSKLELNQLPEALAHPLGEIFESLVNRRH